jgi:hypothetical protein
MVVKVDHRGRQGKIRGEVAKSTREPCIRVPAIAIMIREGAWNISDCNRVDFNGHPS